MLRPRWRGLVLGALGLFALALSASCEPKGSSASAALPSASAGATKNRAENNSAGATTPKPIQSSGAAPSENTLNTAEAPKPRCVQPLIEPPPPRAYPARSCPSAPEPPPKLSRGYVSFPEVEQQPRVAVEVAADEASRQHGLMYRTQMAPDEGMLFSWPMPAPRSFWMRNTCLPLDMLFIDKNGFIVGLLEQVPVLNDAPRQVDCPATYVLEVNAGWARDHGVKPGQRVKIEYSSSG